MKIKNLPDYAEQHRFIVYRSVSGEAWFWGAYDDAGEACEAARDIDGYIYDKEAKREKH